MKYLIYSTLLLALVSRADDLLPEGTQVEAAPPVETKAAAAALSEPVAPAEVMPSLALPVESPVATATAVSVSTSTEVAPVAAEKPISPAIDPSPVAEAPKATGESSKEEPVETAELSSRPVDETASQVVPPPVAVPQINYGPSAEEGYGSVGLKNEGQFMEVGGDKRTEESPTEGDRKTSSLPEDLTSLP